MKRLLLQMLLMVAAASVIAVVANAAAGRERKLTLPGFYPNALKVPQRVAPSVPLPQLSEPAQTVTDTVSRPAEATPAAAAPVPSPATTPAPAPSPVPAKTAAVPTPPAPEIPLTQRFPPHPDKAYVEIGGADVVHLHARGALFLDARRTSVYADGHIAGSRPFSVWESDVDDKVRALWEERSDPEQQNQPIVIYCSGGACEDSHMLADKLWGVQFNNVYVYKDGYPDWLARGGATRKGAAP